MTAIDLSLYKISDTLQLPFTYHDGKVSGSTNILVKALVGLDLPVHLKAVKLFANDQIGVLAHVVGDLFIIVSHYPKTGSITAYLLDGAKLVMSGVKTPPELFISKKMNLKEVVTEVRQAIVASFYFKDGWKKLQLPS